MDRVGGPASPVIFSGDSEQMLSSPSQKGTLWGSFVEIDESAHMLNDDQQRLTFIVEYYEINLKRQTLLSP